MENTRHGPDLGERLGLNFLLLDDPQNSRGINAKVSSQNSVSNSSRDLGELICSSKSNKANLTSTDKRGGNKFTGYV
jgi:hypothetical protein